MVSYNLLRRASPALGFGFLLALSSSFGQTYFISLFAGDLRAELDLSHGAFGSLYMVGTAGSAFALVWIGKLADRVDPAGLSLVIMVGLAGSAMIVATADSVVWLGLALFGLRLGGQGMLSHLAMTSIARWFTRERGRALSIATLGFPTGEALLPIIIALLLASFAWREIWIGIALLIIFVLTPVIFWLGRHASQRNWRAPSSDWSTHPAGPKVSWTRTQVLCDIRFYALLPGLLAPSFIITGVFFHQVHLVEVKGWTLADFAACYPLYAGSATASALCLGWLIDRYGVPRVLPFYLLPLALGLALLSVSDSMSLAILFMILIGVTAGSGNIVLGALWAELYGTAHLGSIRALVTSLLVVATAIAPGVMGWLIDIDVNLNTQLRVLSTYTIACTIGLAVLLPKLRRPRKSPPPSSAT